MTKTAFDDKMLTTFDLESEPHPPVIIEPKKEIVLKDNNLDLEEDYKSSRENTESLIELGKTALERLLAVAEQSDSARDFEVVANLLKTVADINSQYLDIHKKIADINKTKQVPNGPTNIDKAIFVGTTMELLEHVKIKNADTEN